MLSTTKISRFIAILVLLFSLLTMAACSGGAATQETDTHDEAAHDDGHEHEGGSERIANPNGAAVSIIAPADGSTFSAANEVLVQVGVENFDLTAEGNHWHVYVDGSSWGMASGGNTDQSLRGLTPGTHEISVYIAGGDHIEFQQGDSIVITVTE